MHEIRLIWERECGTAPVCVGGEVWAGSVCVYAGPITTCYDYVACVDGM